MTRQEKIEDLQDKVSKNYYTNIEELKKYEPEIDVFNEVLSPMEWNICDRCGTLEYYEFFYWIDGFEWDEDSPTDKKILENLAKEPYEYCALCSKCFDEMKGE